MFFNDTLHYKSFNIFYSLLSYCISLLLALFLAIPTSWAGSPITDSFTDSQGRTTLYRYSLKDEWNSNTPRGLLIFFHGNNALTQTEVLDMFFWSTERNAYERDLIPVVVTSPQTRPDGVTRQWNPEDKLLLKELLSSQFKGAFQVDFNRIIFSGGSQGTCFLHEFTMTYGENYGGGFYGGCGCYNSPDPTWEPSDTFKSRFKVFVHATTEDFLHNSSSRGYAYYKYTVGLNTRGDLDQAGTHCSISNQVATTAYDWILGLTEIPMEPVEPHWQRISTMNEIVGIAVNATGTLWVAQQTNTQQVSLWQTQDQGATWVLLNQFSGQGNSLFLLNNTLFLRLDSKLYRSTDNGLSFTELSISNWIKAPFVTDGKSRILSGNPVFFSDDMGTTWDSKRINNNSLYLMDGDESILAVKVIQSGGLVDPLYISLDSGESWQAVNATPLGMPHSVTWDGTSLWAMASNGQTGYYVYRSFDLGKTWQAIDLPAETQSYYNGQSAKIKRLANGSLVIYGSWNTSWLSTNQGSTWQPIWGAETVSSAKFQPVANRQQAYLVGQAGIFFLNLEKATSTARLTNISTRAHTNTGLSSVIAGFVIQGSGACDVMIRGFGKGIGLSPNLDTQLLLQTFPSANSLAQNSSWQTGNPVASIPTHLHLPDQTDAGIYTRLSAGAYTATMTPEAVTGIGLIGVDEVSCDTGTQLVNISTRAEDRTGAEAMIAGFTIEGEGTIKVMIRGFGSGLGLSPCLDTQVNLQKFPSGDFVASNDNWQTAANVSQIPTALQLPNATDAGLLIDLPAGAYTAIMTPKTGSCNGIGLIGVDVVQ